MSEYQRYEFMTIDRPLTRKELDEVNDLSSHIEASSTHALIEYNWGDFKHNPIEVLRKYFDGFLYWANWGSPELALRFPHGILPVDLINNYDFDDLVTFTPRADYDILDIHFSEMEGPDEWASYELGSLIGIREELMDGDLRALYIAWLACQQIIEGYNVEEGDEEEEYEGDDEANAPPVPPGLGTLTAAQQALAELLQVPEELLAVAARHSSAAVSSTGDDVTALVPLLPPERRDDYLVRLARNEPGLSRLLVRELRELGRGRSGKTPSTAEQVPFATLRDESVTMKLQLERERLEQERLARLRRLQNIHDHQDDYWRQIDLAAARGSGAGYDEAVQSLLELRKVAEQFKETRQFQERFRAWVQPHLRRPALLKRLQENGFTWPQA